MRKVAIHGKTFPENTIPVIEQAVRLLLKEEYSCFLSTPLAEQLNTKSTDLKSCRIYNPGDDLKNYDFVMSIGGDGTLLETITHVGSAETPILGVNTGRLGFLATTNKDMIGAALENIKDNNYELDARTLLRVDSPDLVLFDNQNFCLNEVAVLKQDTSSMITIHTYIDNEFLNSYWSDGLIISTPTGSTGYSLSCGGPVVMPHSDNLILTPVSPHNLNVRPLVVSDDCTISFDVHSRSDYFMLSIDSRSQVIKAGTPMTVKKERFQARLIKFDGYSFVKTLRKKLNWGFDVRN